MNEPTIVELRQRLAVALELRECGSAPARDGTVIKYYLDPQNNPMGLVKDWYPDAPEKIIKVIEAYGLNVQRLVHPDHKPRPGKEDEVVWQYHVWSRHPIYRSLGDVQHMQKMPTVQYQGARVVGLDLTYAVLYWAVLRAERILSIRQDPTKAEVYNFDKFKERVYVSASV